MNSELTFVFHGPGHRGIHQNLKLINVQGMSSSDRSKAHFTDLDGWDSNRPSCRTDVFPPARAHREILGVAPGEASTVALLNWPMHVAPHPPTIWALAIGQRRGSPQHAKACAARAGEFSAPLV